MSNESPRAKKAEEGAPPWVMTFADLMSLLMCFFVLLLSFSEMDVSKYKELAGSLKDAFGVQREIRTREPPKGINIIAREFSPGRPEPTSLNVIRQMTTQDLRVNLDLGKERRRPVPTPTQEQVPDKDKTYKPSEAQGGAQTDGLSKAQLQELATAKALARERLQEKLNTQGVEAAAAASKTARVDNETLDRLLADRDAAERLRALQQSARLISEALGKEIKAGSVDVETADQKIIIRVREKASFASGHAELKHGFVPILARVAQILKGSDGKIIVAGHSDNVPIHNERFRSNWELSAARAVSVAHAMMRSAGLTPNRLLIQGYADTDPVAKNDTAANRAKNRRVEIILQQGHDKVAAVPISGVQTVAPAAGLPAAPSRGQTPPSGGKPAVKSIVAPPAAGGADTANPGAAASPIKSGAGLGIRAVGQ